MYFIALATDFDDTIAAGGKVDEATLAALEAVKRSGRRLILVTGRELDDLLQAFDRIDLFDLVVAENGAVLFDPETREETLLASQPDHRLLEFLAQSGVEPLCFGRSIMSTRQPHEAVVLEGIAKLGLEYQIVFNKGAVMMLPPGINKASGLAAALSRLGLSSHNVVGVGDAENDHAFLEACGVSFAVGNALPALKVAADFVTASERGAGVAELARMLVETDLEEMGEGERHRPLLGRTADGVDVRLDRNSGVVLIAGPSGGGKSTVVHGLIERMQHDKLQCCIIDPEGDFSEIEGVVVAGSRKDRPQLEMVRSMLAGPDANVAINMLSIETNDRPSYFASLLGPIATLRAEYGRPHWLIVDEAHHVMPSNWGAAETSLPAELLATILVTVDVAALDKALLKRVSMVVAVGSEPASTIAQFCAAAGHRVAEGLTEDPGEGNAYLWRKGTGVEKIRVEPPKELRRRHQRKYAEGELGSDKSFYFRGPDNKLNLRAQNLILFQQMAEGVDETTWMHHLRAGHYSQWFAEAIKDEELASEAREIEGDANAGAGVTRKRMGELISRRYTAPAKAG